MKRLRPHFSINDCFLGMIEHPQGKYCLYEDVKDFIDQAMHEYTPRPDGLRCRWCKEREEHPMHYTPGEGNETI